MKKLVLIIFCGAGIHAAIAQNPLPETSAEKAFISAYQLYQQDQYAASRARFEKFLTRYPEHYRSAEAQYYIAFNAINEGQKDAEHLMNQFVTDHASHPLAMSAYFDLGNNYFEQKAYDRAIRYYLKADFESLTADRRHEGNFKLGYSYFMEGQPESALTSLEKASRSKSPYYHDALYYSGIIQYEQQNFQEAIELLLKAESSETYKDLTPEYVASAYLAIGQYDELISYVNRLGQIKLQRAIQLLTAEAYFYKGDFGKAWELYELALSSNRSRVDPLIYYHQGYAASEIGRDEPAIEAFKLAALSSDTVGQYGSYYLGILYTKVDNKQFALNAFENASKSDFNPLIKEESAFRTGQLYFELGQYANCIERLNEFVNQYSESPFRSSANDLISEAYLKTSNYDLAINHIEQLQSRSRAIERVYQQVTLMKGHQLFNDSQFQRAITLYDKSLQSSVEADRVIEANFWKGEAYSIGKKWVEAINAYSKIVFNTSNTGSSYYLKARYGLGYAYYNTKVYDRAKIQFAEYTKALNGYYDRPEYLDALVRLADCYFVEKNYRAAVSNYENALRGISHDRAYIYFQLGLNYGFQGNIAQARRNFDIVISSYPDAREAERALYQKAQLDFEQGSYQLAANGFGSLIDQYPASQLLPHALVKRAVARSSMQEYDRSRQDYVRILNDHINHEVANSALLGLQELVARGVDLDLDHYISRYRAANPDDASLENIEFEAAKNRYFSQDYPAAVQRFSSFLETYPSSGLTGEALYFMADAYKRSGDDEKALEYFYKVQDYPEMNYFNRTIRRIAEMELEREGYQAAIKHYHWLYRIARNRKERYTASEGLMLTYQKLDQADSVTRYANQILNEDQLSPNGTSTANLFLGKSAITKENFTEAISYLEETIQIADDENAAEATYLIGRVKHLQGQYVESNEVLFTMNSKFSTYDVWLGRSFLLVADNYMALDELFQAEATLNSIVENSTDEETVGLARNRLQEIRSKEEEIIQEEVPEAADSTLQTDGNE